MFGGCNSAIGCNCNHILPFNHIICANLGADMPVLSGKACKCGWWLYHLDCVLRRRSATALLIVILVDVGGNFMLLCSRTLLRIKTFLCFRCFRHYADSREWCGIIWGILDGVFLERKVECVLMTALWLGAIYSDSIINQPVC